jgi:transaldolase
MNMLFFIDTADLEEIREANARGLVDGVTTNPSLLAKARHHGSPREILKAICEEVDGSVSAEVVGMKCEEMVDEARSLAKIADNITVKIPIGEEGMRAIRILSGEGIQTNVTLVFSSLQAMLAAKAGATYVSPFIGRLDDIGHDGMEVIRETCTIFQQYGYSTKVIVASIRHPMHVVEAAFTGADIATIPPGVLRKLLHHPLTDIGLERFLKDWREAEGRSTP